MDLSNLGWKHVKNVTEMQTEDKMDHFSEE